MRGNSQFDFLRSLCSASGAKKFRSSLVTSAPIYTSTENVLFGKRVTAGSIVNPTFLASKKLRLYCKVCIRRLSLHFLSCFTLKWIFAFWSDSLSDSFDVRLDDVHKIMPRDNFGLLLDMSLYTSWKRFMISSMHLWWLVFRMICARFPRKISASIEMATVIPPNTLNQLISLPYLFLIKMMKSSMHFYVGWVFFCLPASLRKISTFLCKMRTKLILWKITSKRVCLRFAWPAAPNIRKGYWWARHERCYWRFCSSS